MASRRFKTLCRYVREDGVYATAGAVGRHLRSTANDLLSGTTGYYTGRMWLLRRRYDTGTITPTWVSPDDIQWLTGQYDHRESGHLDYTPYFKPREANWGDVDYEEEVPYGTRRSGNWDTDTEPFSRLLLYRGMEQRFDEGYEWEATDYYQQLVERFEVQADGQTAHERALQRCAHAESVYKTIKREGYRSQASLAGHPLHEVTVTVSREGDLLYNSEGRHRLAAAKILGVEELPVLVLVRHEAFGGDR